MPRMDEYLDENNRRTVTEKLYESYPMCKGKKVMLFAPTYRGKNRKTAHYPYSLLDFKRLYELCGDEWVVLFKMHPWVHDGVPIPEEYQDKFLDVGTYPNINDLFYITDLLITDYSSNIFEYSLMRKPMMFFAFDKVQYSFSRGFHRDYEESAPGKICYTFDELMDAFAAQDFEYEKVEEYQDGDMLKGLLAELDENGVTKEGGIQVEHAVMMPDYMKNDDQKAIFTAAKVNSVLVFNPSVAFDSNEVELASLLKIRKEDVVNHKGNFSYQIEEITRTIPGELNQELFDQVLGKGKAQNEEEFRAQIKAVIKTQYEADSDYKFLIDVRNNAANKVGKLQFADDLMKRIMLENNKEKGEEFVSEHYDKSIEELSWHLIKEKLVAAYGIKVEQDDILNMAKEATRAQFAQYGMINVPDELLEDYSKEMMKKRESVESLVNRAVEAKLSEILKEKVTLNHKAISSADFNKMFE